jgi:dihydropteroate synthase
MISIAGSRTQVFSVINLTPDSFSDGGKYLDSTKALNFIQDHQALTDVWDIGLESTAPFNSAISIEQEADRAYRFLFPLLSKVIAQDQGPITISIDTYKPEIIRFILNAFPELMQGKMKLIWNDISGVMDEQTLELLNSYPELGYVIGHTFVAQKSQAGSHQDFVFNGPKGVLFEKLVDHFQMLLKQFEFVFKTRALYLDPCFGFSKTAEQNYFLLGNLKELMEQVHLPANGRWLIGLSRKSFLRSLSDLDNRELVNQQTEQVEQLFWLNFLQGFPNESLALRVHAPHLLMAGQQYQELIKRMEQANGLSS